MRITRILIAAFLIWTMLILTGCPSQSSIRQSANASYKLAGATGDLIQATRSAYEQGLISIATKNQLADNLILLSQGGKLFNDAVIEANSELKAGKLPATKMQTLNLMFSDKIVVPFLRVLELLKIVSPDRSPGLYSALSAVRLLVLTISRSFDVKTAQIVTERGLVWI